MYREVSMFILLGYFYIYFLWEKNIFDSVTLLRGFRALKQFSLNSPPSKKLFLYFTRIGPDKSGQAEAWFKNGEITLDVCSSNIIDLNSVAQ